jgi:general secretion pathway protein M
MSAVARLRPWWQARNQRERAMLTVMFLAIAAFAAWYGLFAPLRHLRDASQAGYDRSLFDLRQAQASASMHALQKRDRPALDRDQLTRLVLQGAQAAGVAVSRRRIDSDGHLVLGLDSVAAPTLFAWLDTLQEDHGLAPRSLQVERTGATLRAEVAFGTDP